MTCGAPWWTRLAAGAEAAATPAPAVRPTASAAAQSKPPTARGILRNGIMHNLPIAAAARRRYGVQVSGRGTPDGQRLTSRPPAMPDAGYGQEACRPSSADDGGEQRDHGSDSEGCQCSSDRTGGIP